MNDKSALTHQWTKVPHASLIGEILGVGLIGAIFVLVSLWEWWKMPAGSNLITPPVKYAATSLLCCIVGFFTAKIVVHIWLKLSKSKE